VQALPNASPSPTRSPAGNSFWTRRASRPCSIVREDITTNSCWGLRTPQQSRDLTFGIAYQEALVEYETCRSPANTRTRRQCARAVKSMDSSEGQETSLSIPRLTARLQTDLEAEGQSRAGHRQPTVTSSGSTTQYRTIQLANGKPAVELSFRFGSGIGFSDGEEIEFSGHLDRAASGGPNSPVYIVDNKSTGKSINSDYVLQYTPDPQISHYYIGGKGRLQLPGLGDLDRRQCQVLANAVDLKRFQVARTASQISEYYQNVAALVETYDGYRKRRYWPMNESACHICPFRRGLCSHDPGSRRLAREATISCDGYGTRPSQGKMLA
jgi:hypothetical protein